LIRAYRMDAGGGLPPRKGEESELLWQIRRAPWFLWGSSGRFIGLMVHQIDECCWLKDAWPILGAWRRRTHRQQSGLQREP